MTDAADRNITAILEEDPKTLPDLIAEAKRIIQNPNLSNKSKRRALTRVATDFSDWVKPRTPCRAECSHCCHMATAISQEEADLIGEHTGRTPHRVIFDMEEFHRREGYRDVYTGVPCTFLSPEGKCSIYAVRPIACRLHHSLEDTPDPCKIGTKQEVGAINIYAIHHAYINATKVMSQGGSLGDIRQFFPPVVVPNVSVVTKEPT
jgi:Fe-S-cluster containining protein